MIHYHGTPITPQDVLLTLAGRCFCVSHAAPQNVRKDAPHLPPSSTSETNERTGQ